MEFKANKVSAVEIEAFFTPGELERVLKQALRREMESRRLNAAGATNWTFEFHVDEDDHTFTGATVRCRTDLVNHPMKTVPAFDEPAE